MFSEEYTRRHWRRFNVLIRCVGIWWAIGGIAFVSWGVFFLIHPEKGDFISAAIIGALVLAVASGLLLLHPYRPDLGDTVGKSTGGSRKWWTGDLKD